MVIECLELCMPLHNKEKYIEITDVIIPDIIGNYNEILPIKVHIDPEKTYKMEFNKIETLLEEILKAIKKKDNKLEKLENIITNR